LLTAIYRCSTVTIEAAADRLHNTLETTQEEADMTTRRTTAAIAVAVALTTSASAASAAVVNVTANGTSVRVPSYTSPLVDNGSLNAQSTTASGDAFDWGDAGIGAAGGVGLSIVCVGGVLAASHRRDRRPKRATALTS
jgi:hypothetical protein